MLKTYIGRILCAPDANTEVASSTASDDNGAESSTAVETQDDKGTETLGDIVRQAAEGASSSDAKEDEASGSEGQEVTLTEEEKAAAKGAKEEPKADEDKEKEKKVDDKAEDKKEELPPFHKHPRWVEVNTKLSETTAKVKELEPFANDAKQLHTYCQSSGIDAKQFNEGMQMLALVNSNPAEALVKLEEFVAQVRKIAGDEIPEDLQNEVNEGLITEGRAKEISKLRAAEKFKTVRSEAGKKQAELIQHETLVKSIETSVNSWVASKQSAIPGFQKLYPMIETRFMQLANTTPPTTPDAAIKLAEEALAWANEQSGAFRPKPAKKRTLSVEDSSSTQSDEEPETLADVVNRTAAKHRA